MKAVFVVLAFVVLGVWARDLTHEEKQKLKDIHNLCQQNDNTHADVDKIKNLAQNTEDAHVRAHMHCIAVHTGLQKQNGDIDQDAMRNKLALVTDDKTKVDEIVHKCCTKKDNAENTAMSMWLCMIQNHVNYGIRKAL